LSRAARLDRVKASPRIGLRRLRCGQDTGPGISAATAAGADLLARHRRSSLMCHPSWGSALTAAQRESDLARLRHVHDRIGREDAQPLDVEALDRDALSDAARLDPDVHAQEVIGRPATARVKA
jgi:hypothetical protein